MEVRGIIRVTGLVSRADVMWRQQRTQKRNIMAPTVGSFATGWTRIVEQREGASAGDIAAFGELPR